MYWQIAILFPIICLLRFWFISVMKCDRTCCKLFKPGRNVLILTAHPDDECMFFGPLIMKLYGKGYKVYVLCCSSGNYFNQGEVRKTELVKSCEMMCVPADQVRILEDERIKDDPKAQWDVKLLSSLLESHISDYNIQNVITFDEHGVSGHANHKSLYEVAKLTSQTQQGVNFFKLVTTSVLRKYIFILDLLPTFLHGENVFVSSWEALFCAQRAMIAHWSQLVWFRILYICLSRYMIMNHIEQINKDKKND